MPTPNAIRDQINERISWLITVGLADDQLPAFRRQQGNIVEITFDTSGQITTALKNRPYEDIYRILVQERVFNVKMLDGALIQMMYIFSQGDLRQHRLGFFPAPHLEDYQSSPNVYLEDEVYGDVIEKNLVPFPIRYDYDGRVDRHIELVHPKSHLTLGQYEQCRIPVSAPVTPHWFIDFILRNFYDTPERRYVEEMPVNTDMFTESILDVEREVIHVVIPS